MCVCVCVIVFDETERESD